MSLALANRAVKQDFGPNREQDHESLNSNNFFTNIFLGLFALPRRPVLLLSFPMPTMKDSKSIWMRFLCMCPQADRRSSLWIKQDGIKQKILRFQKTFPFFICLPILQSSIRKNRFGNI